MTERDVVKKIKQHLEKKLPGVVVFKIQDYMTAGIPDLAVSYNDRITWIEVKYLRPNETKSQFRKHFDQLQLTVCLLLGKQVPTYYFIAYGTRAALFTPYQLSTLLKDPSFDVKSIDMGINDDIFEAALEDLVWRISERAT
jgi:hypothetical protein